MHPPAPYRKCWYTARCGGEGSAPTVWEKQDRNDFNSVTRAREDTRVCPFSLPPPSHTHLSPSLQKRAENLSCLAGGAVVLPQG